jgi:transcriptional regulator with XRE-family HTH domain
MDRMLSAQQIRAARSLLGWSRRELAIVAGISQGTIKAIEQGKTDARLSTLRKLAGTFTAHGVEFVMEGSRSGVTIKVTAKDQSPPFGRTLCEAKTTAANTADMKRSNPAPIGHVWLRPLRTLRSKI